jgi:hypothetical protein
MICLAMLVAATSWTAQPSPGVPPAAALHRATHSQPSRGTPPAADPVRGRYRRPAWTRDGGAPRRATGGPRTMRAATLDTSTPTSLPVGRRLRLAPHPPALPRPPRAEPHSPRDPPPGA